MGMKLTRERKVYASLLALGLGVLAFDRITGSPSAARAGQGGLLAAGAAALENALGGESGPMAGLVQVALHERLAEVAGASGEGRDIFSIDPSWMEQLVTPVAVKKPAEKAAEKEPDARAPGQMPRVTMVVQDASGGMAVVDGEVVRVGGTTKGGVTLVSVESRAARLSFDGREATVEIKDEKAGGAR